MRSKDKEKRKIQFLQVLLVLGILFSMQGYCMEILSESVIDNTKPEIKIVFNEEIDPFSLEYFLIDENETDYPNSFLKPDFADSYTVVYLQCEEELFPATYTFGVKACDVVGNCGDYYYKEFEIELPELKIELEIPLFGIFSSIYPDLILTTNREAICRYSLSDEDYDLMNDQMTDEFSIQHKVLNFPFSRQRVYFECLDKYSLSRKKEFDFTYDNGVPHIDIEGDDVYNLPLQTNIRVESKKDVICKFTKEINKDFDEMIEFTGYDFENEARYSRKHDQLLTSYYLKDFEMNVFYVQCISKSGVLSNRDRVSLDIDTEKPLGIFANMPGDNDDINESEFKINISTTVPSFCTYTIDDGDEIGEFESSDGNNEYISDNKEEFEEGEHTIDVECRDESWEKEGSRDIDFYVDLTDPTIDYATIITVRNNSLVNKEELNLSFSGHDSGSGIDYYEYMIYESNDYGTENITGWESIHTSEEEFKKTIRENLDNNTAYFVKLRVVDNSGRRSSEKQTKTVTYDDSSFRDDVSCTSLGCDCISNDRCDSGYCDSTGICSESSCEDNAENGLETDIDCGGNCDPCGLDKNCVIDEDCESGNCNSQRCSSQDHCFNDLQDEDETDIDCGGTKCPACGVGKECLYNDDCLSGFCKEGEFTKMCFRKDSDTDGDGINDADDNCPDIENADQEDFDNDGIGDVCDHDKDYDGMDDEWEKRYGLDPYNPDDAYADDDGDGLSNLEEYESGTDPTNKDTDGDGYSDYDEKFKYGTDPTDADSHPSSPLLFFLLSILFIIFGVIAGYYLYYAKNNYVPSKQKNVSINGKAAMPGTGKPMQQSAKTSSAKPLQKQSTILSPGTKQYVSGNNRQNAVNMQQSKPGYVLRQQPIDNQQNSDRALGSLRNLLRPKKSFDKLSEINKDKANVSAIFGRNIKTKKSSKNKSQGKR